MVACAREGGSPMSDDERITKVFFEPGHYTVLENVGQWTATVVRRGGNLDHVVLVDYKSEDGTASGDQDYVCMAGTITFQPGETSQSLIVEVIDDDVFEEDEHHYLRLNNPRFASAAQGAEVQLGSPYLATAIVLDDDHC